MAMVFFFGRAPKNEVFGASRVTVYYAVGEGTTFRELECSGIRGSALAGFEQAVE
jgi:hypothetical protein